jgi:hypothetical protein
MNFEHTDLKDGVKLNLYLFYLTQKYRLFWVPSPFLNKFSLQINFISLEVHVLIAVVMTVSFLGFLKPCSLVEIHRRFGGT